MSKENITQLVHACRRKDQESQRKLFGLMYSFAMSIASRYGQNNFETEEIANNALYKMLHKIDQYKLETPFQLWLRRIIINCGIDYYRKYHKHADKKLEIPKTIVRNIASDTLETDYLLDMIRKLSPKYRMVFNLFVMEGFSHEEIAKKMEISVGTSKSNLSKARKNLQKWVIAHQNQLADYGK